MKNELDGLKVYTQKSALFLWPLLNITTNIKPVETYMYINSITKDDNFALSGLFYNKEEGYASKLAQLKANSMFDYCITDGDMDLIVFDLEPVKDDYLHIELGNYSHISRSAKVMIHLASNNDPLVARGLHPEYYYEDYAKYFQVNVEQVVGNQLLPPPDVENETITFSANKIESILKKHFTL